MCCSSYDYLSSKTSGNLLGRGLVNIAVPAGGEGGAISPPNFQDLGKIQIFRAKSILKLGKIPFFLEITMISERNFFSGQKFQTNFLSYS